MGVAGSGKSTVAKALALAINAPFIEGDDFHTESNLSKMTAGTPLNDSDRIPWLKSIHKEIRQFSSSVVACSALKKRYRDTLFENISDYMIVYLNISEEDCLRRLQVREGHFFSERLCHSQFEALEPPEGGSNTIVIDALQPISKIITILRELL